MKINIMATNMDLTAAIKEYFTDKIESLTKYHVDIIEVDAEVELTTNHHNKGDIYRAELNIDVPGKLIRVDKTADDLYKAIDKVKDHAGPMLRDYKEKMRDQHRRKAAQSKA